MRLRQVSLKLSFCETFLLEFKKFRRWEMGTYLLLSELIVILEG